MRIADGVEMLEISAIVMGSRNVIYPVVLYDDKDAVPTDAGYPGQLALFREAMEQAEIPFGRLTKVVVTHQDIDHIGSLPAIIDNAPQKVEVLAGELEKPYIQGDRQLLRFTPEAVEAAVGSLPSSLPEEARTAFRRVLENPPKSKVDKALRDGDEMPFCGGITVIGIPGHTPGHIGLYHKPSRTLIAGDAMWVIDGRLEGPVREHAIDYATAVESLKKLAQYNIDAVVCYHGGLYRGNVNERIARLASGD